MLVSKHACEMIYLQLLGAKSEKASGLLPLIVYMAPCSFPFLMVLVINDSGENARLLSCSLAAQKKIASDDCGVPKSCCSAEVVCNGTFFKG